MEREASLGRGEGGEEGEGANKSFGGVHFHNPPPPHGHNI